MKSNNQSIFNHALKMVKYNKKNYIFLSVTIILSFTFMLCFFIFQDSNIYNKYKYTYGSDNNIVTVGEICMYNDSERTVMKKFTDQLDKIEDTYI